KDNSRLKSGKTFFSAFFTVQTHMHEPLPEFIAEIFAEILVRYYNNALYKDIFVLSTAIMK
ncbi:MAG: hypothetical protein J6104_04775, partial [Methanomicrobium sp.]|nr:hypothetical protein [Methanomicrobium sp.]